MQTTPKLRLTCFAALTFVALCNSALAKSSILQLHQIGFLDGIHEIKCNDQSLSEGLIEIHLLEGAIDKIAFGCVASSGSIYVKFQFKDKDLMVNRSDILALLEQDKSAKPKTISLYEKLPPPTGYPSDFDKTYLLQRSMKEPLCQFEVSVSSEESE